MPAKDSRVPLTLIVLITLKSLHGTLNALFTRKVGAPREEEDSKRAPGTRLSGYTIGFLFFSQLRRWKYVFLAPCGTVDSLSYWYVHSVPLALAAVLKAAGAMLGCMRCIAGGVWA